MRPDLGQSARTRTVFGRGSRTLSGLLAASLGVAGLLLAGAGIEGWLGGPAAFDANGGAFLEERSVVVASEGGVELRLSVIVDTRVANAEEALQTLAEDADLESGLASAAFVEWMVWPGEALPITLYYNAAGATQGINAAPLIEAAIETWNAVSGQAFRMAYGGATATSPPRCSRAEGRDGIMTIGWRTDLPPGTLATTCAMTSAGKPVEVDISFSSAIKWTATDETPEDSFDYRSTLLHELGHAVGLDHSSAPGAVMLAQLSKGQQRRALSEDDIAGIRFLYPAAEPTATAVETATPEPSATPTPIETPRPPLENTLSIVGIGRD